MGARLNLIRPLSERNLSAAEAADVGSAPEPLPAPKSKKARRTLAGSSGFVA
jgi:hypothetical protein